MEVENSGLIVQVGIWTFQELGCCHEKLYHVALKVPHKHEQVQGQLQMQMVDQH